MRDPIEAADDEHLRARGLLSELHGTRARRPTIRAVFSERRFRSSFAGRVELPPAELLGTSTDAVLRDLAGCDDADLARLRADGSYRVREQ